MPSGCFPNVFTSLSANHLYKGKPLNLRIDEIWSCSVDDKWDIDFVSKSVTIPRKLHSAYLLKVDCVDFLSNYQVISCLGKMLHLGYDKH